MTRKITSIVLALIMILSLAPCVLAETVAEGKCGDSATWTLDDAGTLTIDGTGVVDEMAFSRRYRWTEYATKIKKAVVGEGITGIKELSFEGLRVMEEISLPESLTIIEDGVFYRCTSLKSINVAEANANYKSVDGVLYNKSGTELIQYPCGKDSASLVIPEGTAKLANGSVNDADKLVSISIPATVTEIEPNFYGCIKLEEITVAEGNESFVSENGILFNADKTVLRRYPAGKTDTAYTIPETVETIGDYAFQNCAYIEELPIPASVTSIGVSAFNECLSLKEVTVPGGVQKIYRSAFGNCLSLRKATILAKITNLDSDMFNGCERLGEVVLPDSITEIKDSAFSGCDDLVEIKLPAKLETIYENAFEGCRDLTEVRFPKKLAYIGQKAFYNCKGLKTLYIPISVTYIGDVAFRSTGLTDVYYDGNEAEWKKLDIGSNNVELTRYAEIHYNNKPYINGELDYDIETGVMTVPLHVSVLDCVLIAAVYKDNALVNVVSKPLAKDASSDSITVAADGAKEISVYIWGSENDVEPMCENKKIILE